jgi:CelD/BcsL family acetyltransferase involved in cellulose biosynthesis
LQIQIINPIEYPAWDELLLTSDQSCFFHTSAWAKVLSESYGYQPLYFTAIEDNTLSGLIALMEIKSFLTGCRGVSLPFTDFCPPVAEDPQVFEKLLAKAIEHGRNANWKSIEFRGGENLFDGTLASASHLTHSLRLDRNDDNVFRNFKSSTRRNIRKSGREDVRVTIDHTRESIDEFYRLNCLTRKKHGLPPQPQRFFQKFFDHIISARQAFVALAKYAGQAVAGGVYLQYREQGIYKYGASDTRFQHLRPNNLVMWEAIKWFCCNGYTRFNFGRTEPGNEGLLQFKRGWGVSESVLAYFKYDIAADDFVSEAEGPKTSYRCFKIMPTSLLKLTGNLLYRHVG